MHVSRRSVWAVWLLAAPAFVAIWSGWVQLGTLTGFGKVQPLPGLWDGLWLDSRITLPVGMEAYAALALRSWLDHRVPLAARRFARTSAFAALGLGAAGQVAYHLMAAAGVTRAPWPVTAVVACLPVAVLGMGAALAHLLHASDPETAPPVRVGGKPNDAHVADPSDRTDRTDRTTKPQVTAGAFRQIEGRWPVDRTDKTRRPRTPAASGVGERVRALAAAHPDATRAQLADLAGCSLRTVHRHLSGQQSGPDTPAPPPEPARLVSVPVSAPVSVPVSASDRPARPSVRSVVDVQES